MLPINPDPIIGADASFFEDECAEDDWDCDQSSWLGFVTDSLQRLARADYSNLSGDFATSLLLLLLFIGSWRILQFVFHKLTGDKKGYQGGLRQLSGYGSSIQGVDGANRTDSGAAETDDQPDTDLRAAGDSWEQDEYDPDYDANNEIMVMLLQGTQDESDDVTPIRSDAEEEGFLEELTRPEDEVQLIEIQNEANDTLDLQAATNEEENSNDTAQNEVIQKTEKSSG